MSSGAQLLKGSAAVHRELLNHALTSAHVGFGHDIDKTLYGKALNRSVVVS